MVQGFGVGLPILGLALYFGRLDLWLRSLEVKTACGICSRDLTGWGVICWFTLTGYPEESRNDISKHFTWIVEVLCRIM